MKTSVHGRTLARTALIAVGVGLGLTLAACGSSGSGSSGQQPQAAQQGEGQQGQGRGGFGGPGGSGKVAAVSGHTAQVQGTNSQVAVSWTSATTFSQEASATAGELKVGDCVVALPSFQGASGSPASASASPSSTVAASTVRISAPVKGSCATRGFGGGGFGGRSPQGGAAPSGAPSGGPGGGFGAGRGFGAFGQVTAVSGSGFTVKSVRPGSSSTSTVSVTTNGATTWTREAAAAASDVKVGRCVVSRGRTDSTGAITAMSIAISQPVNGQCSQGFGGRRPGGFGQGGGQNP